jgi:hypothetical protein
MTCVVLHSDIDCVLVLIGCGRVADLGRGHLEKPDSV